MIRHTNAFTLGVQKAHPGAKVKIVWTNYWFAPGQGEEGGREPHAAGADVLGQNVDSPAAGQYAESAGIPWVGYDSDAQKFAPKSWLTAAIYNWGPYYLKRVKAAMNGTWKTGNYYGSMKDGFTPLAPFGTSVSAETKALIAPSRRADQERQVERVRRADLRPGGQARIKEGQRLTVQRPLLDELARQGRHREPEGLDSRRGGRGFAPRRPAPMPAAVALRGITKRFPGVVANDGVDFEAAEGEVHALLGENGAGKSTLSNILTGLYQPDAGEIALGGRAGRRSHSPRDAIDAGVGMVHQHFRLVAPFTVAENVMLGDHRGEGGSSSSIRAAIERRVAELGERTASRSTRARVSGSCRSASSSGSRS